MTSRRQYRVAELIQHELGEMIAYNLKDPRLSFVSVTRVEVNSDLRHARVYVSGLAGESGAAAMIAGLEHASGYLRKQLGQRTALRYVPELTFHFDQGLIESQRMNTLLDHLAGERGPESPEAPGET